MDTTTTCARHPDVATRLTCSACGTPICPRCSVDTPVGQKCPACARLPRGARAAGKPRQFAKGGGAGVAAAVGVAVAYSVMLSVGVPFLRWIAAGFGGYAVAKAVQWGAERNRAPAFRNVAVVLSVVAIVAAWLLAGAAPSNLLRFRLILSYAAAAYGAWLAFQR